MRTSRTKSPKKYWEMTADELAAATREFDREFIADQSRPLSPRMAARWRRARQQLVHRSRRAERALLDRLRSAHRRTPFEPFILHLVNGHKLEVAHPELLAISPTGHRIVVMTADGSFRTFELELIKSIQCPHTRRRSND